MGNLGHLSGFLISLVKKFKTSVKRRLKDSFISLNEKPQGKPVVNCRCSQEDEDGDGWNSHLRGTALRSIIKKQSNGGERGFGERIREFKMLGRESNILRKACLERIKKKKKSYVFLNNSYLGRFTAPGKEKLGRKKKWSNYSTIL